MSTLAHHQRWTLRLTQLDRSEDGIEKVIESRKFLKFLLCSYGAEYVLLKITSLWIRPFWTENLE
jgi:hypothetical protein